MRFCEKYNCNNKLDSIIKHDDLIYRCAVCYTEYPPTPSDTLMVDEYLQENNAIHKFKNYLLNAHDDTISELTYKDCDNKNCTQTIVRVIKVDKNGRVLYVCPTCKTQFT